MIFCLIFFSAAKQIIARRDLVIFFPGILMSNVNGHEKECFTCYLPQ